MIPTTLHTLKTHLASRLSKQFGDCTVELSALNKDGAQTGGDVLLTLVHIEEEAFAKQQSPYKYGVPIGSDGRKTAAERYAQPELRLNLYILVSAQHENYETALHHISGVIRAFQAQNTFKVGNEAEPSVIVDLFPLKMEQNINLWQSIGYKLMPSVLYKVRMLVVQESVQTETDWVESVHVNLKHWGRTEEENTQKIE